jgi:hypothetical protein
LRFETGVSPVDFQGFRNREKGTIEAPGKIAGVSSIPVTEKPPFMPAIFILTDAAFCVMFTMLVNIVNIDYFNLGSIDEPQMEKTYDRARRFEEAVGREWESS